MPIQNLERPSLTDDELEKIDKDDLVQKWKQLEAYTKNLEVSMKETESKLKAKYFEITKLKNIMLMNYVSSKEIESTVSKNCFNSRRLPFKIHILFTFFKSQFQDSASSFSPSPSTSLSSSLLSTSNAQANKTKQTFVDPAVNAIIIQLKKELEETKKSNQDLKNELSSTKFSPER